MEPASGPRAHLLMVCGIRRSNILTFLLTVVYILYLIVGAILFPILDSIQDSGGPVWQLRGELLQQFPCLSGDVLDRVLAKVLQQPGRRASFGPFNGSLAASKWDFGQAFFFSATTITTIGYGHVTPFTMAAKLFSMLYSCVGIPLTLLLLTVYDQRLRIPSERLLAYLKTKMDYSRYGLLVHIVHITVVLVPIVIFMFIIPAIIFTWLEHEWTFTDSLYFCFISLTTIGLGDYVPGENPLQKYRILYKISSTGYLLIGLVFMVFAVNTVAVIPVMNVAKYFHPSSDELTSDPEKMPLQTSLGIYAQNYTNNLPKVVPQQVLIPNDGHHYDRIYATQKPE